VQQVTFTALAGVVAIALSSGSQVSVGDFFPRHPAFEPPVVFQAAGPNAASIQSTVDQYRLALGNPLNGNTPGPLAAGRREINWDGGSPTNTTTSPGPTPFDVFLNSRGAQMTTPGSGFVQAPASGLADVSGNPSYVDIFQAFSPQRLFAALDSNVTKVKFFIPGTSGGVAATTTGFGAVFADVDQPDGVFGGWNDKPSTFVEYYNVYGHLIYSSAVPPSPGNKGLSFIGVVFSDSRIARVRIISGNVELGRDDSRRKDVVVMDDFLYGEPQAIQ